MKIQIVAKKNNNEKIEYYPLSLNQEQIWNLWSLYPQTLTHNISTCIEINKELDIEIINQVINTLFEKHDVFKTRFVSKNSKVYQCLDLQELQETQKKINLEFIETNMEEVVSLIEQDIKLAFDLTKAPLFRLKFFKITHNKFIFYYNVHHIIWDGVSNTLFFHEFMETYDEIENKSVPIGKTVNQKSLKEYAQEEITYLKTPDFKIEKSYWENQLSGKLPSLDIKTDNVRPQILKHTSDTHTFEIDSTFLTRLESYVQKKNISLYNLFFSAYFVLLHKETKSSDIIIGTPIHGRHSKSYRKSLGCFINTLPIRMQTKNAEASYKEYLYSFMKVLSEAFYHQRMPFDYVLREIKPHLHEGRSPVFQTLFVYLDVTKELDVFKEKKLELIKIKRESSHTEIDFYLYKSREKVEAIFEFRKELFSIDRFSQLEKEYLSILESYLIDEDGNIDLIKKETKKEKIAYSFDNYTDFRENDHIISRFQTMVKMHPDQVAIYSHHLKLSYRDLDLLSDKIAKGLIQKKIKERDFVGVLVGRNEKLIPTLLGILKAGASYVPLDPKFPEDRLLYMCEKASMAAIVCDQENDGKFEN